MDSSYISLFRDSSPSFFQLSYLNYIELLSILLQKYNPVVTKTDIGGEKMKREDQIADEIQYPYYPERNVTTILTNSSFSLSEPLFPKQRFRKYPPIIPSEANYRK